MTYIDIWSRGSNAEGLGHIIRSSIIAKFLIKKGHKNVHQFIECDEDVKFKLKKYVSKTTFFSINENPNKFLKGGSVCVVDRFVYTRSVIKYLKKKYKKIVIFDELQKINYLEVFRKNDIVVRAQLISKNKKIKSDCKVLKGLSFFIINKKKKYSKKATKKKIDIIIMLGGGVGYFKYYNKIAHNIKSLSNKLGTVMFIMGHQSNIRQINKISSLSSNFKVVGFVEDPIKLMLKSKIGIMSGGYSKYEAAYAKLPSLIMPVKKHQVDISKEFCKFGGGLLVSSNKDLLFKSKCVELLNNSTLRKKLSKSSHKLIDGMAMERIYRYIT